MPCSNNITDYKRTQGILDFGFPIFGLAGPCFLRCLTVSLILLLLRQPVEAAPVFHPSLKAANAASAADQGLVMIVFSASWCAPCKQLKARTLSSKEFMEQGGALHVVEIDVDAEGSMARDYDVEAVPTLVLATADNKIVARRAGFLETAELLLWLRDGRELVKQGKWEGTAHGSKLSEFLARASADQLDTNDLVRLVEMLGEPNPADREAAAKLLMDRREQAITPLMDALTNSYLGTRITASELLRKLAPDAALIEPWQAPAELAQSVADLKKWWGATGKLPAQLAPVLPDPHMATSIIGTLDVLRGTDPVQRTEAMSALVAWGPTALPAVREAIKQSDRVGDQRSLLLLEDVRWAILVPDELEQRTGGVRSILARGKGSDRQSAVTRLAKTGRSAIPALTELVNDSDSLVVESAVRGLSSIGGKDAIPAMAGLLTAEDSNLRMTAAQALGHTKNAEAVKELLAVFGDPNEVVACAALSALDEINGERYSPSRKAQPPEVVQGLKLCLADTRWRVRATAAEVTGKIGVNELVKDLNSLLSDPDGFVVKNALEALQKLGGAPEPQKLLAVAQQHSDLRKETIEILVRWGTDEAVKTVTQLYHASAVEERIAIVQSLHPSPQPGQETSPWQPLLGEAAMEADPRLRRATAQMLAAQPPKIASSLVGSLLSDKDQETLNAAAGAVLSVIGRERQVVSSSHGSSIAEFVFTEDVGDSFGSSFSSRRKASVTNEPPATAEQIVAWHNALQQRTGSNSELLVAIATYVTGSTNAGLPELQAAVEHADRSGLERLSRSAAMAALIPRLPWPEGKPIVERFSTSPALFLKMTAYAHQAPSGFSDFLFEPDRFRRAVDPAQGDYLDSSLQRLLGSNEKGWSLISANPRSEAVVHALLEATNAVWRAAAVYSLGLRDDPKANAYLEHALTDTNSWVRVAAVSGLAKASKERPALERLLGPMLSDPNKRVAEMAVMGLLEPETRAAAEFGYASGYFEYENVHVWSGSYEPNTDQRPLATLQGNPPFLETVRQKLASASSEDAALLALLLAQYGDFSGLERCLSAAPIENQSELGNLVLTSIGLSRDAKYLPYLKKMIVSAKDDQDYRRLLQGLKGMTGPEARELRLEINKRMRQGLAR